jgi:hypothetical protein
MRREEETKPWILPASEAETAPDVASGLELIAGATLRDLRRVAFLEHELIPALGLNNELLREQPARFGHLFGRGLGWRIWQYPNQFARYLVHLARQADRIDSYLEIGTRYGGTFGLTVAYIRRFNPGFRRALGVDLMPEPALITGLRERLPVSYLQLNSTSAAFKAHVARRHFSLALIDGDHAFPGVVRDYVTIHGRADILVFHDINSVQCPGTTYFWLAMKAAYRGQPVAMREFLNTYDDVPAGGPFLGIGCIDFRPHRGGAVASPGRRRTPVPPLDSRAAARRP